MWIQDVIRKFAPAGHRGPHVKFTWCISVLSPSIFVMLMKTTKKSVKLRHCCVQRRCSSTQTSGDGLNGRFGFMPCRSIMIYLKEIRISCCPSSYCFVWGQNLWIQVQKQMLHCYGVTWLVYPLKLCNDKLMLHSHPLTAWRIAQRWDMLRSIHAQWQNCLRVFYGASSITSLSSWGSFN